MVLTENRSVTKREINDLMRQRYWADQGPAPIAFFCECDNPGCYRPVWLTAIAYDAARLDPTWLAFAEGHPLADPIGRAA